MGKVGKGEKPDHSWMSDGKLVGPEVGKDSEQGMFSGCRVDVNRIAGYPGENLWVGGHGSLFSFLGEP